MTMDNRRRTGTDDDADIDLDTQELAPPGTQEPLGYGPGEWASSPLQSAPPSESVRAETADSETEQRLRRAEASIHRLRATARSLQREIALMRADLERLRQESEKAAGSRLP
jgi:hypothetical protein